MIAILGGRLLLSLLTTAFTALVRGGQGEGRARGHVDGPEYVTSA